MNLKVRHFKIGLNNFFFIKIQGCYGRTDGRTEGSVTTCISLRNFVGDGIKTTPPPHTQNKNLYKLSVVKGNPLQQLQQHQSGFEAKEIF